MSSPLSAASGGPASNTPQESVRVIFQPNGRQGDMPAGTNLLEAARRLGVEIESICGGHQTCGKCKVIVESGDFAKFGVQSSAAALTPPGAREVEYAAKFGFAPDARLSCACDVLENVVIRVPEESQTRKQVVRKAAGVERPITVDAPMRLFYVELPAPTMKDHRGDWERLQAQLEETHGLTNLTIDLPALRSLQPALAASARAITVTLWHEREVVRVQPGFHDALYGLAVDVGTTTVAGHLCHLRTGEILASASCMNPQVPFGEDLMSRVSYSMMNADGTDRMHAAIIDGLNGIIADCCAEAGVTSDELIEVVLVGNTTMHHLLLGVDPRELGGAPFSLVTHAEVNVKARDLGLRTHPGANVYVPPCEAGHVGADNVGVLVAETPYLQDEQMLILDIGTNGEILLGNRERLLSASSPTGPAFEGAQIMHGMRAAPGAIERVRIDPATLEVSFRIIGKEEWITSGGADVATLAAEGAPTNGAGEARSAEDARAARKRKRDELLNPTLKPSGICGSGIIEAIAELFKAGVIAPNGRFAEFPHERLRTGLGDGGGKAEFVLAWAHETAAGSGGRNIVVHSDDIRAIQLGKAALYAGAKLLMNRLDLTSVDKVVLAGGFGSYIDPLHAMILGLIPDCDLARVYPVGNAAGDGARMMLLDRNKRTEAAWAARWATYIETAVEPSFQDEFVAALDIPNARDPFPHLAEVLESARSQWPPERALANATAVAGRMQRISREDRLARREQRTARRGES
jgi:uncharacterized 2Fe-2S/4Fe-4S cluster protein (DUF4445 family)